MCDLEVALFLVLAMLCVSAIVRTVGVHSMAGLMLSIFAPALTIQILAKAFGCLLLVLQSISQWP